MLFPHPNISAVKLTEPSHFVAETVPLPAVAHAVLDQRRYEASRRAPIVAPDLLNLFKSMDLATAVVQ
jgi:hypothetical protein